MNTILTDDEIQAAIREVADLSPVHAGRAVIAAYEAKLAQQEPVAWQWRKKDQAWSVDRTFNSEVYATTADSEVRALYAHPAPQQADRQRVPDDLKNRCVEILGWQKTGVLAGNALRDFAKQKYGDDPHALQMAETETAREAYRVIAAAPEAPAQASAVDERDRKDAERYRWLRDALVSDDPYGLLEQAFGHSDKDEKPTAEDFDACISAALAQKGGDA